MDIPTQGGGGCAASVSWTTPESQVVTIVAGDTTEATGTYSQGAKSLKAEVTGGLGDMLLMPLVASGFLASGRRKAIQALLGFALRG